MEVTEEIGGVPKAQLKFAISLYKAACESQENVAFCPPSVCAALAMVGLGAKGSTASQLTEALHVTSLENTSEAHSAFNNIIMAATEKATPSSVDMILASSLFLQDETRVLPEFLNAIETHYGAHLQFVDYRRDTVRASDAINTWTAERSQDKILNVLPPNLLNRHMTKMVLVNAVYMKGLWATKFHADNSFSDTFYLLDGTKRKVDMMHQHGAFRLGTSERLNCSILEMPYADYQCAMYIVLPASNEAFENLERLLDADELEAMLTTLHKRNSMYIWLPCFQAECSLQLHKILPTVGVQNLFSEKQANLAGISKERLALSTFLHKTVIVFNEKGREAADISTVVDIAVSLDLLDEFYVNRPFLYFVRHNQTGTILFLGKMTSPPAATRTSCGRFKCFCKF